jgi:mannose-6-phosphate isomerase
MAELYPLKFEPILKEKVWGGKTLETVYNKKPVGLNNIGESWELSSYDDNLSVVSNGFLAGNNIEEIIEVFMGDITGDIIFEKFGTEFPLLFKFIEAKEDLSIQVHPNETLAMERHNAHGKTEMWYILKGDKKARIYTGFRDGITKELYKASVLNGKVADLLNVETAEQGDAFFTPAGRIHAIGAGTVLVEIQQTSDLTYRISDWNRIDSGNTPRKLHIELALDALDFNQTGKNKIKVEPVLNKTENLVGCEFFNTNIIRFNNVIDKEYYLIDSFVVYICLEGEFSILWDDNSEKVRKGETVLLPAMIKEVKLKPVNEAQLLEVYIKSESPT